MKKISINNEHLVIENFKLLFGYQLMMTKHKMVQEQENHKIRYIVQSYRGKSV